MNGILATLGRELRAYFLSPLAYIVAALLLVVNDPDCGFKEILDGAR